MEASKKNRLFDTNSKAYKKKSSLIYQYAEGIVNTVRQPLIVLDADLTVLYANRFFYEAFNVVASDTVGQSIYNLGNGQWDIPCFRKVLERILPEKESVEDYEIEHDFESIGHKIMLLNAREIHVEKKEKLILLAIEDVTSKRRMVDLLISEKDKLDTMLRSIGDGVIATDVHGNVIMMNQIAEMLTGWTQEESLGKPVTEIFIIINEISRKVTENPIYKVLEKGIIIGLANHTLLICRDGSERIIADSGSPIRDGSNKIIGAILVFRDITYQHKIEEELQKVQKLESIGLLAGGIAHDFNNYLASILSNITYAKMLLQPTDTIYEILDSAEKASLRAKELTHQLLTFSKGGAPIKKTQSLTQLIKDSVSFVLRGSNVSCKFHIQEDLLKADVDAGQINQVISNLVMNALQSMPAGGEIMVNAENIHVEDKNEFPLKEGRYIKLSIADKGIGISKDHVSKVFDPYFTTKQKGSGLGLAVSYSIIKKHDGYTHLFSDLGKGTIVSFYLPASENQNPSEQVIEQKLILAQGKILIMDDEELVLETLRKILIHIGYQVEIAMDGAYALDLYTSAKNSGDPFDVVILDLTVPNGMGGEETIRKLKEIDPHVKAIVSSGYSDHTVMAHFNDFGFVNAIAKPFNINELVSILSLVINK